MTFVLLCTWLFRVQKELISYGRKYRHARKSLFKCSESEVAAICNVLYWCDILEEVPSRIKILAEISKVGHTRKQ